MKSDVEVKLFGLDLREIMRRRAWEDSMLNEGYSIQSFVIGSDYVSIASKEVINYKEARKLAWDAIQARDEAERKEIERRCKEFDEQWADFNGQHFLLNML